MSSSAHFLRLRSYIAAATGMPVNDRTDALRSRGGGILVPGSAAAAVADPRYRPIIRCMLLFGGIAPIAIPMG